MDIAGTLKRTPHRVPAGGFSLVELLVAVALGLLLLAAMLESFNSNSATGTTNTRFAELQTNGRYAVDFMRREIQHAGYLGLTWVQIQKDATASTDYGCGGGFAAKVEEKIWGSNDGTSVPSCVPADHAGSDVLVLRRLDLQRVSDCVTVPAFTANTLYMRTEFLKGTVFLGSATPPPNLQPPCEDYKVITDVYYISNFTNTAGDGVPALKRLRLTGPAATPEVIATGIENMQVQYGVWLNVANTVAYLDANAVNATDWPNIASVRLWLLARSTDQEASLTNTSTYVMGRSITVNDHFARQVFPLVVQLRK